MVHASLTMSQISQPGSHDQVTGGSYGVQITITRHSESSVTYGMNFKLKISVGALLANCCATWYSVTDLLQLLQVYFIVLTSTKDVAGLLIGCFAVI